MKYAVLHHQGAEGGDHFDFLIERTEGKGDLMTWRVPLWPVTEPTEAVRLRDHRRIYLTYEGEVSGGRGAVIRVDEGDAEIEFPGAHISVRLPGDRAFELHPLDDEKWFIRPFTGQPEDDILYDDEE